MIAVALCGFETDDSNVGSAENILGLTLEKAIHEAAKLCEKVSGRPDTLTAGSLEGRLKALDDFIGEYMVVTWKEPAAGERPALSLVEGSAES